MRQPDLVLVMTDQQRFDQLGCTSEGHFETPNIDGLAASGVVFDAAYSAGTTCVPARNALLTGIMPHRLPKQINHVALREGFWTIAHALSRAGYETALIGKMHFAPVHARHGFETMRLCEHLHVQGYEPPAGEQLSDDYHEWLRAHGYDDWRYHHGVLSKTVPDGPFPLAADLHPTSWIERETLSFLEQRKRDRPLFLVVSFPHPHAPYNPPEPYASMYEPADSRLPASGFEINEGLPPVFREAMTTFGDRPTPRVDPADPGPLRRFLATVRGLVRQIDDSVGRILERIDLSDSIVFFTSDHGDYAGHRGMLRKIPWIPYEDLARVPFVVAGRDVDGGRRATQLVQSCDIPLTCLDYAGVAPPPGVEWSSRSIRPLLEGRLDAGATDRAVFCGTSVASSMARRGPHKYIWMRGWDVGVLFDVIGDPAESVNLSEDPAFGEVCADLRASLEHELSLGTPDLSADS